jgi:hypothetical protein
MTSAHNSLFSLSIITWISQLYRLARTTIVWWNFISVSVLLFNNIFTSTAKTEECIRLICRYPLNNSYWRSHVSRTNGGAIEALEYPPYSPELPFCNSQILETLKNAVRGC